MVMDANLIFKRSPSFRALQLGALLYCIYLNIKKKKKILIFLPFFSILFIIFLLTLFFFLPQRIHPEGPDAKNSVLFM